MTRIARRTFIKTAAAGMLGPRVATAQSPDFVVVGAGAFGAWTALHLRELGHRVTLVDALRAGEFACQLGRRDEADPRGRPGSLFEMGFESIESGARKH